MLRLTVLFFLAALGTGAAAQPVVFDEGDGGGSVYLASDGEAAGGDALALGGPDGRRLPLTSNAFSGVVAGAITSTHTAGTWRLDVGAPGFASLDFSQADSLVLRLDSPAGVPGARLPNVSLVDAAGHETARLPLNFRSLVGLDAGRSGFLPGSPTDARFRASYVSSLPADRLRPGYPESLTVTFSADVVATSTPAIGFPAIPARFLVTGASGQTLPFRFADFDGDGTLSTTADYIEVLLPETEGSTPRSTWRLQLTAIPAATPAAGDVYRLAVFNGGVDSTPGAWQRRGVALSEFGPLGAFDRSAVRAVRFSNPDGEQASASASYTLWVDVVTGSGTGTPTGPAAPTALTAEGGDRTVVVQWTPEPGAAGVLVYRRDAPDGPFRLLTADRVTQTTYADLEAQNGTDYTYVLRSVGPASFNTPGLQGPDSAPVSAAADASVYDPYLELTERLGFDYFWEQANPANGLIKDRSTAGSASSIAAVGFGLSAITVGADRGYITRAQAVERTLTTLRFFATCPQSVSTTGVCGYKGFFYHFLNMQTGERAGTNELSTIDTALLLGGVLHAATYYDADSADEREIRSLADAIWRRVDWAWATPRPPLVALGWKPESGFLSFDWRGYNEASLLYVLGLGSPTHPLRADAWSAWSAGYDGQYRTLYGQTFLTFPPLFGHQYSQVWIDFRGIQDDFMRSKGSDYFENSRRATLASQAYSVANPGRFPNYSADEWGLTASDDPFGYRAHGAPPAQQDNGTITPTAAGGSIAFTPDISREALRTFYARYRPRLWGPYGLRDAYNVKEGWVGTDYLGIDQGPIVLMLENERTGAIWSRFMTHPDVKAGLARAGFLPTTVADEPGAAPAVLSLEAPSPNPARGRVSLSYTLPAAGAVRLDVFDILGRLVARLEAAEQAAGIHTLAWDASGVAPGVYVVRLDADGRHLSRRLVVAR